MIVLLAVGLKFSLELKFIIQCDHTPLKPNKNTFYLSNQNVLTLNMTEVGVTEISQTCRSSTISDIKLICEPS